MSVMFAERNAYAIAEKKAVEELKVSFKGGVDGRVGCRARVLWCCIISRPLRV